MSAYTAAADALATWGSGPNEPDDIDRSAARVAVDAAEPIIRQDIADNVRLWCDHIVVGQYHHTCAACEYIAARIQAAR